VILLLEFGEERGDGKGTEKESWFELQESLNSFE
jgi:hypothetical protein